MPKMAARSLTVVVLLLLLLLLLGNDGGCSAARQLLLPSPTTGTTSTKVSVNDDIADCNPIGVNQFDSSRQMACISSILQSSTTPPGQSSGN
jgi:hypothetical protein